MDALASVMSAMRVEGAVRARLEARGDWGVRFANGGPARFGVLTEGTCWIRAGDAPRSVRLGEGDCFILPRGGAFELRATPETPVRSCGEIATDTVRGVVAIGEGEVAAVVTAGTLSFDATAGRPLVEVLPFLMRVPAGSDDGDTLSLTLDLLSRETARPGVGTDLIANRLGEILFIQAVRRFAASEEGRSVGWLGALSDRRVGAALRVMHAEPARAWTVEDLAREAGMSRSAFAERFRELVGEPPLEHLTAWRMYRATCHLRDSTRPAAEVAALVGYGDDAAFNRAFKRALGVTPAGYRREGVA